MNTAIDYYASCETISGAFVPTEATNEAHYRMQSALDQARAGLTPRCTLLVGVSGAGKTQTVRNFAAHYPEVVSDQGSNLPVVYCRLEANSSVNDLTVKLLEVLDVPLKYRTTMREKRKLLYQSLRNLQVKMIIFDESQQIIERRTDRVKYQFIDELKLLIDELNIAIVLVGLPSLLEVSTVNSQLDRRSFPPLKLSAFDYSDPQSQKEFLQLIASYMRVCEPLEFPNLCSRDLSWRLYCACSGRKGHLASLMQQCILDCRSAGKVSVTKEDFEKAVERVIFRLPSGLSNPFSDSFDVKPNEVTISQIVGRTHEAEKAMREGDQGDLV